MEVTLSDLQRTYAAKDDDELLQLHGRGTLTDLAYDAIEAEMAARAITIPPRPAPDPEGDVATEPHRDERLRGLGGWLILMGIGVVVTPLRSLATAVSVHLPIFTSGAWLALTTVGSDSYHPLWGPIIIGEVVFNLG